MSDILLLALFLMSSHQFSPAEGAKILLYPLPVDSHYLYFSILGQELHRQGHDVSMVTTPKHNWIKKMSGYGIKLLTWNATGKEWPDRSKKGVEYYNKIRVYLHQETSGIEFIRALDNKQPHLMAFCTHLLEDTNLLKKLVENNLDLIILDGVPFGRCQLILPHKLGVPHVMLSTFVEPWLTRTPALPSFVPFTPGVSCPQQMSFWQKLTNIWIHLDWILRPNVYFLKDELVTKYAPEKPFKPLTFLAGQSLLWLYNTDPLLDGASPIMPNAVQIGGLTTGPAKPLTGELANFVKGYKNGLIVVSFGSLMPMAQVPPEIREKMVAAFNKVPKDIGVIWKNEIASQYNLSSNILTLSWLPQNDLLGQKNVRLFITHCGSNGQFEAVYHGVPMLGLPIFSDQQQNAKRMTFRGYGVALNLGSVTEQDLLNTINELLSNTSYSDTIKRASKIYRSRRLHPKERAVGWINHVIKFGGGHLHSHALELPWYQYIMADLLVTCGLIIIIITKLIKCCMF